MNSKTVHGDEPMPLTEHLKELRTRMLIAFVPVILVSLVFFIYSNHIIELIWKQVLPLNSISKINIYTPMELIISKILISIMFGLFIGIPLIIYESFMFIGKGLYEHEKKFFIKIVPFSFILFTIGAIIAYFFVVPLVFKYTIFYSTSIAVPQISVMKTINVLTTLVIGFGIIFQLPLLLVFAMKMDLIKPEYLKSKRKIIYAILVAFALYISPDPSGIAELTVAISLVLLFEFSLLIVKYF